MVHKNKGNEYFQAGENAKALYEYHFALNYLGGLQTSGANTDQTTDLNDLTATCNLNMAAVFLKTSKPDRAVRCCKIVLDLDDNNAKGERFSLVLLLSLLLLSNERKRKHSALSHRQSISRTEGQ